MKNINHKNIESCYKTKEFWEINEIKEFLKIRDKMLRDNENNEIETVAGFDDNGYKLKNGEYIQEMPRSTSDWANFLYKDYPTNKGLKLLFGTDDIDLIAMSDTGIVYKYDDVSVLVNTSRLEKELEDKLKE